MARPAATLAIMVEANTSKAARSLRAFDSQLGRASSAAAKATTNTSKYGRATATAAKQTDRLHRSNQSLGVSLKGAAKGAAALAGAYVGVNTLTGAITDTIDLGKATDRLSTLTGLSIKTASEWIETAKVRKIQSTQLNMGFITLAKNIKAATEATGTQRDLFNQLGISMEDLKRKNFQQTLLLIADRIKALGPGFQRASVTSKLFGRSAQSLAVLLASGSKGIKEQLALVEKHGAALTKNEIEKTKKAAQAQRELALAFDGLKKKVSLALFDAGVSIKRFIDKNGILKISLLDITHAIGRFVSKIPGISISFLDVMRSTGKAWRAIKSAFSEGVTAVLGSVKGMGRGIFSVSKGIISTFVSVGSAIRSVAHWIVGSVNKIVGAFGTLKDKIPDVSLPDLPSVSLPHFGFRRGGPIDLGKMTGDSVPALLERGEYVLNRNATKKIGKRNLDAINFSEAPRFAKGGGIPAVNVGGSGAPRAIVQGAADVMREAANAFIKTMRPKAGPGGTKGPKGVGTYAGMPMANWVIESLKYAASKGVAPTPTSGYRSHAENVAAGRNYYSEHEGTQYPHGAVDFGGYNTGLAAKMSVVRATAGFKYPLLAPIGFHDDGHASGTGHKLGGLIGMATGGEMGAAGRVSASRILHYFPRFRKWAKRHGASKFMGTGAWTNLLRDYAENQGVSTSRMLDLHGSAGGDPAHWRSRLQASFQKGGLIGMRRGGGVPGWVHGSSTLSADQLASLAHYVHMPNPGLMSQIAQAESGGNPRAMGGAGDKGLWQEIPSTAAAFGSPYGRLFDPLEAAKAAKKVVAGQGLTAWTTYNDGSYRGYPKGKVFPIGRLGGGGGGRTKVKPQMGLGGQMLSLAGGTLPIKGSAQGLGGAGTVTLPGLGSTALPGAGLPGWAQSLLKTPGISYEGKLGVLESAISSAGETPGTGDDLAALSAKMGLLSGNKNRLLLKLAAISKKLRQGGLTPKQRKALLAQQATVLSNLGSTMGEIGSTREAIQGLKDPSLTEETAQQLADQLQKMNELLAQQVANQQALYNVSQSQYGVLAQAIAAVASGQIGGSVGLGFSAPATPGTTASY